MFNKSYDLPLSKNYVRHWGVLEAVRELIQNAIDSESPFNYEFVQYQDSSILLLKSEFTTLSSQTLLLGSTSKAESDDSIGSFGEGYKIALLVLTRAGKEVRVLNGDKLWKPEFKHSDKFNDELLSIKESSLPHKNKGLTFEINNLSEEEVAGIIESCLLMQRNIGEKKTTKFGDILLDRKGKLYVGGLYICDTELDCGYDILPKHIKLERDRQTVNSWDLGSITRDMWFDTKEFDKVAELIEAESQDVAQAYWYSPDLVKEACYKLFKKNNPGAVVAKNQEELKQLVAKGMEKVVVVGSGMYSAVSSCASYRKEEAVAVESPHEQLARFFRNYKFNMHHKAKREFESILHHSKSWRRS